MDSLRLLDLHFGGRRARDRRVPGRHRRRPRALRLRPHVDPARARRPGSLRTGSTSTDIRHLLLSHIHLDHAGAAGSLVRGAPGADGLGLRGRRPAPRRPSRLERSARRLYGDAVRPALGRARPVPEENVRVAERRRARLGGVPDARPRLPPRQLLPRRDPARRRRGRRAHARLRLRAAGLARRPTSTSRLWHATADAIRAREPERLALIHFGVHEDVGRASRPPRRRARPWAERVRRRDGAGTSSSSSREADAGADVESYDQVAPLWQCWHGLKRYWDKKRESS